MKAIVTTRYGSPDGLQIKDIERPAPGYQEILIRVHASSVTAGDVILRKMPFLLWLPLRVFMGLRRKPIPGHEFAGEVVALGKEVTRFQVGDPVFGTTTGLSAGSNAEYVSVPESWSSGVVIRKPDGIAYDAAAVLPVGGMTALEILNRANIQPGQRVLINGASGSVGTFAVQIARVLGAVITGICSTQNVELVRSLGAVHVVDYTQEDITHSTERYDVIFDTVGKLPEAQCKHLLLPGGVYLSTQTSTHEDEAKLAYLAEMVENGDIRPVIDRRYPLARTPDAHRYVESGHKSGNVVVCLTDTHLEPAL